jgi:hypothetical protein
MTEIKISDNETAKVLPQTMAIIDLLKAAGAVAQMLPVGSPQRAALVQAVRAFENEAAIASYTLEDMMGSVHSDPAEGDPATAALALGLLYKDFPHPWEQMAGFYRHAEQLLGSNEDPLRADDTRADNPRMRN